MIFRRSRLSTDELPASEITAGIAATSLPIYYLPIGCVTPWPTLDVPMVYTRVVLIPHRGSFAALQAAHDEWCAAAGAEVGLPVSRIDATGLLRPTPRSPWARATPELRARLLMRAIALVAAHTTELGVFDQREYTGKFDGVAIEHMFFGLVRFRADLEDEQVMVLGSGGEEPGPEARWLLRQVFTADGSVWRRGVVLAPAGALAGVELATVASEVVAQMLVRRIAANSPRLSATDAANSPPPLAPVLVAALEAGATVLARLVCSLDPPDPDSAEA